MTNGEYYLAMKT